MTHSYITDNIDPVAKDFQYEHKYSQKPDVFAALGYDTMLVLSDALKRAENI